MSAETLSHPGNPTGDRESSSQQGAAVEQPVLVPEVSTPWSKSKKQRLGIAIGTAATALGGIAMTVLGTQMGSESHTDPNSSSSGPHETLQLPNEAPFRGVGLTSGKIDRSSISGFTPAELAKRNTSLESADPREVLIPLPFNPGQQEGVVYEEKKIKIQDGTSVSGVNVSGFTEDVSVRAAFKGNVYANEVSFSTADSESKFKIVTLKTINKEGKQISLGMTVPDGVQLDPRIPLISGDETSEGISVELGESLFTIQKGSTINTENNKNNIEMVALAGDQGNDDSLRQVNLDFAKDISSGRIASIN